jgi:hypothetical protein
MVLALLFPLITGCSCTPLMAASAQVNSRMQLNLLACGWFLMVVVLTWWLAWTLMLMNGWT